MGNKKNSLGDRMKEFYENRTRNFLPRRTIELSKRQVQKLIDELQSTLENVV